MTPAFEERNVVLTGFMGTGKSTVGRRLAAILEREWIDTDRVVEERYGPISEIFARGGEAAFRRIERVIAAEASLRTGRVISTGGRMLLDDDNVRALSKTGRLFCLTVDVETLTTRLLRSPTPRPLLAGPAPEERIRSLLAERAPGYRRFAQIDGTDQSPDAVAATLAELVESPTATPWGRAGVAVLPDATDGLDRPVVLTDARLARLHAPSLGPVSAVLTDPAEVGDAGTVVALGGTSVTEAVPMLAERGIRCVVAPTTLAAMHASHPDATRVVIDVATLQTGDEAPEHAEGWATLVTRLRSRS